MGPQRLHPALSQGCWKEGTRIIPTWVGGITREDTHLSDAGVHNWEGFGSAGPPAERLREVCGQSCACDTTTRLFSLS